MDTLLNEFEVMTLHEAYKRIRDKRDDFIIIRASWKRCKENLPTIIRKKLIEPEHLKYCGIIRLTEKGIEAGRLLDETLNK